MFRIGNNKNRMNVMMKAIAMRTRLAWYLMGLSLISTGPYFEGKLFFNITEKKREQNAIFVAKQK